MSSCVTRVIIDRHNYCTITVPDSGPQCHCVFILVPTLWPLLNNIIIVLLLFLAAAHSVIVCQRVVIERHNYCVIIVPGSGPQCHRVSPVSLLNDIINTSYFCSWQRSNVIVCHPCHY